MFEDVPDRLPAGICVRCRRPIEASHAIVQVLTAAGVGPWSGVARTVHINDVAEAAHLECSLPALTLSVREVVRSRLKPGDPAPVPAKAPEYQCVRCGKTYRRGDRFVQVYRAEGIAKDPDTSAPGLRCTEGFETAHLDCSDTELKGEGAIVILGSS